MSPRETERLLAAGHELANAAESKIIDIEAGLLAMQQLARQYRVPWTDDGSLAAPRLRTAIADFRRAAAAGTRP